MYARAWPLWLLPFALSACDAEPPLVDAAAIEAGVTDGSIDDDDAGPWRPPALPPPTYAPTFNAIFEEVFEARFCRSVFCHGIGGGSTLDLSSLGAAYESLVNHEATGFECRDRGLVLVSPGAPEMSLLFDKIASETPSCGERMPRFPGITVDPREIAQIRQWIEGGALNN